MLFKQVGIVMSLRQVFQCLEAWKLGGLVAWGVGGVGKLEGEGRGSGWSGCVGCSSFGCVGVLKGKRKRKKGVGVGGQHGHGPGLGSRSWYRER